jgi:hypothetical protein
MDPITNSISTPPRRTFFRWLTGFCGAVTGAVVSVPLIGYLLGQRKTPVDWVTLGTTGDFPIGETRTINFENPLRQPWDGITGHTGVFVRNEGQNEKAVDQFQVFAVNCAHLG